MKTILSLFLSLAISTCLFAQDYEVTKIGILGCHNQGEPAPSIPYFANTLKPKYSLWVGDNVYADTKTDPQHIERQLNVLLEKEGFKELRDHSTFMVTWDDHDYGLNDAGKDYIFREESKQIHRKFWALEEEIPTDQPGVYYAKLEKQANGKVIQFIMIDGRFNRDKPGKKADALGESQWKWLEEQLKQKADVRFLVSGYQVLLEKPTRWEAWIKLGKSRERLFKLIKNTGTNNVIFVTGDQHTVEVLESAKSVNYKTYEIMAAGINKTERPGKAKNRVLGPDVTVHSSPMIEVHWTEDPYVLFRNYDVEQNAVSSEYKFSLSAIDWRKEPK
jgi:alkaline phosphatase D